MRKLVISLLMVLMLISWSITSATEQYQDWLMFNHNPARTGYTTNEASPPFLHRIAYRSTSSVRSSLAITDRYAVVGSHDHKIYCYATYSFGIRWSFLTGDVVQSSPTIADEVVLCGSDDGYMYCINLNQTSRNLEPGDEVWRFKTGGKVRSSPLVIDDRVYFTSHDSSVYCLDLYTGQVKWSRHLGGSSEASPTYYEKDDLIIVGSGATDLYAFKADTGNIKWICETDSAIQGSCSVKDDRAFVGTMDNGFFCVEADSGQVKWKIEAEDVGVNIYATPALVEDKVIVCSYDKEVKCYYQDTGDDLWTFHTNSWNYSSPAIGGDHVFFGSDDQYLYCLKWKTGDLVWKKDLGSIVQSSPVIYNEAVYVGTWDGTVQLFHPGPVLGVEPTEIDFGDVELGTTPTKDLSIINKRNDQFETELEGEIRWDDQHLEISPNDFYGIGNGSERRVRIKIDPSGMDYGNYQALLKVTSNGGDANIIVRWKVITPAPACMDVNPTEIDFGFLERGEEKSQLIQLTFDTDDEVSGMIMGEDRWIDVEPITFTSIGKKAMLKVTINASRVPSGTEAVGRIIISTQNEVCQQVSVEVKIATEPRIEISMIIGESIAYVNFRPVELDVAPYVSSKGRTLVPLRFISETFGAKIQWIADEKKIIIERFDKSIIMWIGKTEYKVDGIARSISTPPEIKDGRTMVPFRAIAEAFGADVTWDSETKTVGMVFIP